MLCMYRNEVQSLLTTFGGIISALFCVHKLQFLSAVLSADISKNLESKRKRLETFTQSSVKASSKRVEEIWRKQQQER